MPKVPVQKGPIEPDQRTMKHNTRENINREDARNDRDRFSGQTLRDIKKK